jgi:LCP family protein required for cell wall assembly
VGFTVLGTILPGTGLIAARRRLVGGIVLGVFLALVLGLGIWAIADTDSLISALVNPRLLRGVGIGLVVLGVAWVVVVVVSHLMLRRTPMTRAQRAGTGALVGVLCFVVAAPMAIAARYSYDQASLVSTVFRQESQSHSATRPNDVPPPHGDGDHPWAGKSRVNVLLLGGDAGKDRTGNRTDTIMVASIDTQTGDTTLVGLPRNTARMPFPKHSPLHKYYPHGFTNGNGLDPEYFLNAMYDNVPEKVPKNVLGKTDNLGADAMKISVGDAVGLKIDYYVLINLKGFVQLVDALGGITVNINEYVAIGGNTDTGKPPDSYLKPGPHQHLKGKKALWFARGRYGASDFQRMDRQRCVINAMINQAHPANVLSRYESIAKAGKKIVKTDIPQEKLSAFVDLSRRVKNGHVRSVVFKNAHHGFYSAHPDFQLMRNRVKKSIQESKKPPKKTPKPKAKTSSSAHQSPSASPSASSSSQNSRSTSNACAYDPQKAAHAHKPQ